MAKKKETLEQWNIRREEALKAIEKLRLMDDILMTVAFKENLLAVQCMLRIILNDTGIIVMKVIVQDVYSNLRGRGVRLDIHAVDSLGRHFNVEIQKDNSGVSVKRIRHNGALMDAENIQSGGDPKDLPDTYVIFICENDPYKAGLPVYTVEKRVKETGAPYDDGMHYLFVNGEYTGDNDYGKLAADLRARSPEEMHFQPLADAVRQAKQTEKGVSHLCTIVEQYGDRRFFEGHEEGREEGREETSIAYIKNLMETMGATLEQAMAALKIPEADRSRYAQALANR